MLERSIVALAALSEITALAGLLVVLGPDDATWEEEGLGDTLACQLGAEFPIVACAIGGASRRDSVLAGIDLLQAALGPQANEDWVMVHDAARPGLRPEALRRLWSAVQDGQVGGLLALPIPDTVKRQAEGSGPATVAQTLSRAGLWLAQTPQIFGLNRLAEALQAYPEATDEASAIENAGLSPILVEGDPANHKLTYERDFTAMTIVSEAATSEFPPVWPLVGQGFDVHALVEGRALILGGVTIPYEKGLLGHSDADALLHAICDALLGAAGLGDIGKHFPDVSSAYKDADSRVLLREVVAKLATQGLVTHQIDATIVAQAPKMAPHIAHMVANIQADCGCPRVNVKATTTEWLGFTGRGEGIACQAMAVVVPLGPAGRAR
jgi:2-C-methyl-D-erythritol 2,4-cyclodiphosphate synthase/2-C-methyl-D-erythritol 4-phosphate cytidylyltransferase